MLQYVDYVMQGEIICLMVQKRNMAVSLVAQQNLVHIKHTLHYSRREQAFKLNQKRITYFLTLSLPNFISALIAVGAV